MSADLLRTNPACDLDHLVIAHLPMVRFIARGIHRRVPDTMDVDDLFSAGVLGLVEASAKFDPSKQSKFSSFAQHRVRGAILDFLRSLDWAPRELRRQGRAIDEASNALSSRLGRNPSEEEIAAALHIDHRFYQHLLYELDRAEIGEIHRERPDGSEQDDIAEAAAPPEDDPLARYLLLERRVRLARAVEELPDPYRLVITLSYFEGKTLPEIGLVIGLSANRAQQIRASAQRQLREALSDLLSGGSR